MASRTQTVQRKPATKKRRSPARTAKSRATARKPRRPAARATGLPGWSDLAGKKNVAKKKNTKGVKPGLVEAVPTLRFAVLLVTACALFTLYVGHVYATQALVADVQQLRKDNLRLVLKHNRLRGEFDRMTSPAVILDRAAALGLEPSADYAPAILVPED